MALISLAGTGLIVLLPKAIWVGVVLLAAAVGGFFLGFQSDFEKFGLKWNERSRKVSLNVALILLVCSAVIVVSYPRSGHHDDLTRGWKPPTFRYIFDHDLQSSGGGLEAELPMERRSGPRFKLPVRILYDSLGGTKFIAVFLPAEQDSSAICSFVLHNIPLIIAKFDVVTVVSQTPGDTARESTATFAFSKMVYFYMEQDMPLQAQASVERQFEAAGMHVQFRGDAYYALHSDDPAFQQNH